MKMRIMNLRIKTVFASLAALLLLAVPALADFAPGTRVPTGTATGQGLRWNGTSWVFSGLMDTGAAAYYPSGYTLGVGGVSDGSALYVAPSGTAQNGVTVKMPSGSTGYAWRELSSTGSLLAQLDASGNLNFGGSSIQITGGGRVGIQFNSGYQVKFSSPSTLFTGNVDTGNGLNKAFTIINSYAVGHHPLLILQADSTQNADYLDVINTSTSTTLASIGQTGVVSAPSYSILSGGTTTAGYTGNIPTTAQNIHVAGGVIIGYTNSAGTTVGN